MYAKSGDPSPDSSIIPHTYAHLHGRTRAHTHTEALLFPYLPSAELSPRAFPVNLHHSLLPGKREELPPELPERGRSVNSHVSELQPQIKHCFWKYPAASLLSACCTSQHSQMPPGCIKRETILLSACETCSFSFHFSTRCCFPLQISRNTNGDLRDRIWAVCMLSFGDWKVSYWQVSKHFQKWPKCLKTSVSLAKKVSQAQKTYLKTLPGLQKLLRSSQPKITVKI